MYFLVLPKMQMSDHPQPFPTNPGNHPAGLSFSFYLHLRTFLHSLEREKERGKEREREGQREGNISAREKHQLVASLACPDLGANPQPKCVPWLGIEPITFWCTGWCSNQLSHTSQGHHISLETFLLIIHLDLAVYAFQLPNGLSVCDSLQGKGGEMDFEVRPIWVMILTLSITHMSQQTHFTSVNIRVFLGPWDYYPWVLL